MSIPSGSLQAVEDWAKHEFPDDYAKVASLTNINLEVTTFDGECMDDGVIHIPKEIITIEVGHTSLEEPVYAWITENSEVKLCYPSTFILFDVVKRYFMPVTKLTDIEFSEPFSWLVATGDQFCIDRLETLICYMFLRGGDADAVQPRLGFFKTHFRDACRDVAHRLANPVPDEDMDNSAIILGKNSVPKHFPNHRH
jgi:hypothetical protein